MQRTRIDRYKVKQLMAMREIEIFEELIKLTGLSQTTFYAALDSHAWKSQTLDAIANALACEPWDITTRDKVEA